jgi:hypothetical protein
MLFDCPLIIQIGNALASSLNQESKAKLLFNLHHFAKSKYNLPVQVNIKVDDYAFKVYQVLVRLIINKF